LPLRATSPLGYSQRYVKSKDYSRQQSHPRKYQVENLK
jgi:hypothetical protein